MLGSDKDEVFRYGFGFEGRGQMGGSGLCHASRESLRHSRKDDEIGSKKDRETTIDISMIKRIVHSPPVMSPTTAINRMSIVAPPTRELMISER